MITTLPRPQHQAETRSPTSSSSAENSPVWSWSTFFADKRRESDTEAGANSSSRLEALPRTSSDGN
eukprot:3592361-Heterocapsa_arctica.AAC.1